MSAQATGTVRAATARDLSQVAALWREVTEHHREIDPLWTLRADAEGELQELLFALYRDPDAEIFVYDDDGDIPGMCIVRVDRAPPILEEVERAEITDLGVREGARRAGIGRALAERAVRWVREGSVRRVEVQVAAGNREGQGFWRALGFGDLMHVLQKRL